MRLLKNNLKEEKETAEKSGRKVALYFQDEAGFSLTTDIGYTWFKAGNRPELKASVSRKYIHLSGAADPESGDIFLLLLPWLNTVIFQIFLNEFAKHVKSRIEAGYEIWLAVDRAGWHIANDLIVPEGIRLIILPTGAATINPAEPIWEFIRKNYTKCKVHETLEELQTTLTNACNFLAKSAQTVVSICHTPMVNKCTIA